MGKNTNNKEKLSIVTMVFCIIGVVLTVLGIMLLKNVSFRMTVIGTEGTVTGVQTSTDSNGEIVKRSITLTYQANKANYNASLDVDDPNIKNGDKKTIYYDFLKPEIITLKRNGYQGYVALLIGLILVLKTGPRFYRIMRDNYI